jgi:peptidoglycan hydrolase CwlO-like protein
MSSTRTWRWAAAALSAALLATVMPAAHADTPTPGSATANDTAVDRSALADLHANWERLQRDRVKAEQQFRDAQQRADRLRAQVARNKEEVAAAEASVSEYARALYRGGAGSELAVVTSVVDTPDPEEALHAAGLAEQVGTVRRDSFFAAEAILEENEKLLEAAEAAEKAAKAALVTIQRQVDEMRRSLSEGISVWAATSGGGALSAAQANANREAAQEWSQYLARLASWRVPSVTLRNVNSGALPDGVTRSAGNPGVGWWSSGKRSTVVLPDRTIASVTYAVSLLGTPYKWRSNSSQGIDCASLLTRTWETPFAGKQGAFKKGPVASGGVRGVAKKARLLPAHRVQPGDWVFIEHPGRGVNHAGIAISADVMIAADPMAGAVAARPIPSGKVWRVGRMSAPPAEKTIRVPQPTQRPFQCGSDPRATRGLMAVPASKDCPVSSRFSEVNMQPAAILAGRCAARLWPELPTIGGWRPSDPYPDHPSGRALDLMLPDGCSTASANADVGNAIATFFMRNARALNVEYIIWKQSIWNAATENPKPLDDWRAMGSRGSCTANHIDHVHVSFQGPDRVPKK